MIYTEFESLSILKIKMEREANGGRRRRIHSKKYESISIEEVGERVREVEELKFQKKQEQLNQQVKAVFAHGRFIKFLDESEYKFFVRNLPTDWTLFNGTMRDFNKLNK